jgi:enoyl-CoA hydratase/carnithine racemase
MSRAATIGQPEVLVGILPGGGGTQRMTRIIGISQALEMMLLGKRIYADEAERIGLIHRACDPDELMPAAIAFAKELAAKPPLAVALIKRCIYEGIDMTLQDGLALEWDLFLDTLKSDDAINLMKVYVAGGQDSRLIA